MNVYLFSGFFFYILIYSEQLGTLFWFMSLFLDLKPFFVLWNYFEVDSIKSSTARFTIPRVDTVKRMTLSKTDVFCFISVVLTEHLSKTLRNIDVFNVFHLSSFTIVKEENPLLRKNTSLSHGKIKFHPSSKMQCYNVVQITREIVEIRDFPGK